jgi:protein-tyrosine phosphatase
MLAGLDDGARDLAVSLAMARIAVAEGISTVVCTPHILPTVYDNTGTDIRAAVNRFEAELARAKVPLRVLPGADVHIAPNLVEGLHQGRVLSIADSRYILLEAPHHIFSPALRGCVFNLMAAGYIPILTHPERLAWIGQHYELVQQLARAGTLVQITCGSLIGHFGRRAQHWSLRMLDEGFVDVIATDAHNADGRPPRMTEAVQVVADRCGKDEANKLVLERPRAILDNSDLSGLLARRSNKPSTSGHGLRLFWA